MELATLESRHLTYLFKSCILINWIMMQVRMQSGSMKGVLFTDKDTESSNDFYMQMQDMHCRKG